MEEGIALLERTAGKCSCRFCPADSGAAGTCRADESKIALPPPSKGNVGVVILGHKMSYESPENLPPGRKILGRVSIKQWLERFQGTGSGLYKNGAGEPSVNAGTAEIFREDF
jgi:hypothetical protein